MPDVLTPPSASGQQPTEGKISTSPKIDYILLPLISLLTVMVMFAASELVARLVWQSNDQFDACLISGSTFGPRDKPNCSTPMKNAEGPWITDHYNDCGYRTAAPCSPKRAGSLRIVLMGSSFSQGLYVPMSQTFSEQAARRLSRVLHRPVDIQNLGHAGSVPAFVDRRIGEALSLKPDLVLYAITPFDLAEELGCGHPFDVLPQAKQTAAAKGRSEASLWSNPFDLFRSTYQNARGDLSASRTVLVAQHFLFQNRDTFIRLYLLYGDKADFLRSPTTPAWKQRYAELDQLTSDMARKVHDAGSQLALMPIPSRIDAALLDSPALLPQIDPLAFERAIAQVARANHVLCLTTASHFARQPHAERLFYVVDGHPTSGGHTVIADAIVDSFLNGTISVSPKQDNARVEALTASQKWPTARSRQSTPSISFVQ